MNIEQVNNLREVFSSKTSMGKIKLMEAFEDSSNSTDYSLLSYQQEQQLGNYIESKASHGRVQFDGYLLNLILGGNNEKV